MPPNSRPSAYGDDPGSWHTAFEQAASALNLETGRVGLEPEHLRFLELQYLNAAFMGVDFVDGTEVFRALRLNKDDEEVAKMRHAAMIAQEALLATLAECAHRNHREGGCQ